MNTFARARLGSTSSITGSEYLSLFSALFSCCGSKQSLRSPDSFVATTRLLTQSVGSSTGISTPMSVSLSSSALSLGLMAKGTRRDGAMVGGTEGSTSRCCNPSSVPKSPSNTSRYSSMIAWAVCCFVLTVVAAATFSKFSSCTSIRPICCITAAPSSGLKFSLTTMNSTEYFFRFLGFRMVTRHIPSGLSSVLFHICKTRFVGWISSLLTYLIGRTLTVAPQSIWNLMGCSLISICA